MRQLSVRLLLLGLVGIVLPSASGGDSAVLKNLQTGNPGIQSIGRLSFGPEGVLLIADTASVVAIQTGDTGPVKKLAKPIKKVDKLIAGAMGKPSVSIEDMTVNPLSGRVYISVKPNVLFTIDSTGKLETVDLAKVSYVRVKLPSDEGSPVSAITGVSFAEGRVLAAGQSGQAFRSKIFSLPLPLKHGDTAAVYSAETFHVAHGRWETRAPIQSFIPFRDQDGKDYVVGSFACTPIAKFPLDDLADGAKVKGTSVLELGSGNRPLDMFTYTKGGEQWLVTNTYRFHFKKNVFGPSKWWGVRVAMKFVNASSDDKTNKSAARRDTKEKAGPEGVEIVDALFGVVEVAKLNDKEIVVLRDDENGALDLEIAELP
ncbi:MAG: hypothetical protein O3A00_08620 [Planctomycetota bacterium]|nr:hypothetical protein [Planctomycetota bacterium]